MKFQSDNEMKKDIHIKPEIEICFLCGNKFSGWENFFSDEDTDYEVGPKQITDQGVEYYHVTKMWHRQCARINVDLHIRKKNSLKEEVPK